MIVAVTTTATGKPIWKLSLWVMAWDDASAEFVGAAGLVRDAAAVELEVGSAEFVAAADSLEDAAAMELELELDAEAVSVTVLNPSCIVVVEMAPAELVCIDLVDDAAKFAVEAAADLVCIGMASVFV